MGMGQVPIGADAPQRVNAVIEIPRGGSLKYEYDEQLDVIRLDRVLHSPLYYPVDYGFIPETCSPDGDHLDVLVIVMSGSFPGCVMEVRPVALLRMIDEKGEDYKILAVPTGEPRYENVTRLDDLAPHLAREIEYFFEVYKTLENKQVEVLGWQSLEDAHAEIVRSMAVYRASHPAQPR